MSQSLKTSLVLLLLFGSTALRATEGPGQPGGNPAGVSGIPPLIDLWYGDDQRFGAVGTPQRWANILGNVSHPSGISGLMYSLNGGSFRPLNFTSDSRRLARDGDFNIDLKYSELNPGTNTVLLRATATSGDVADTTVTVTNLSGPIWPLPFSFGWSQMADSAQIVDGKWSLISGGVSVSQPGYDRLIAIGDTLWNSYQIVVPFKVYGLDADSTGVAYNDVNGGPAVGLILRWKGHTNTPTFSPPITQPLTGYLPFGAIQWFHWRNGGSNPQPDQWETVLADGNNLSVPATSSTPPLYYGVDYFFKVQVQTVPGTGHVYRTKVWQAGSDEPSTWLMVATAPPSGLSNGSFLLVAHHVYASFGPVTVTPLTDGAPPVISNIATVPTALGATITWTTDEPANGSVAYGLTTSYGSVASNLTDFVRSHSIRLDNLQPNTIYHFAVNSADWGSLSSTSNDLTFQTAVLTAPQPPTLLSPADGSSGVSTTLALRWNRPLNATAFHIQLGTDPTFVAGILVDDAAVTDTLRQVTGLVPGTRYYWRVSARNNAGESAYSGNAMFVTALGVPLLVSPANGGPNALPAPTLTWHQVNNATSYRVRVATDSTLNGLPVIDDSTVVDTFHVASGLQIGQKYYWRVRAKNSIIIGNFSAAWAFTPGVAPPTLLSPANGSSNQPLNVTLQWSSESLADAYDVQLGTDSTFASGLLVSDSLLTDTSRAVTGLSPGTVYYWRARSRNASGPGAYSPVWSFSTGLSVTQLLAPGNNSSGQPLNITFIWRMVDKATSYAFQLAKDSTFASDLVKNDPSLPDTSRFVAGLSYKTTYYWHVRPREGTFTGPWSATWRFTTLALLPGAVTLIQPANGASVLPDSVHFIWSQSQPNVTHYWFEISLDSLFNLTRVDSASADTTAVMYSLTQGATYYWRVRAGNLDGWGPFAETRHFTALITGVAAEDQGVPQSFALDQNFPNPFNPSTWIRFALPKASHVRLEVYNVLGALVSTIADQEMEPGYHRVEFSGLDTRGRPLAAGIYIYRLVTPGFTEAKKMILLK
jgi:hypothetical protein